MRYGLTRNQHVIFSILEDLTQKMYPVAPTTADLLKHMNASRNALELTLKALRERGWIDWIPGRPRSIVILPATDTYYPSQYKPGRYIYHAKLDGTFGTV